MVTAASVSDVLGGKLALLRASRAGLAIRRIWADYAYRGLAGWPFRCVAEVVRQAAGQRGFKALPRPWVVERSFARGKAFRRVATRYERKCDLYDGFVRLACAFSALARL